MVQGGEVWGRPHSGRGLAVAPALVQIRPGAEIAAAARAGQGIPFALCSRLELELLHRINGRGAGSKGATGRREHELREGKC